MFQTKSDVDDSEDSDKENIDPQKFGKVRKKMASQQKPEGDEEQRLLNEMVEKINEEEQKAPNNDNVKKEKGADEQKTGESSQSAQNPIALLEHEWADIRKLWSEMESPTKEAEEEIGKVWSD